MLEQARPDDRSSRTGTALRALASSLYELPRSWEAREEIAATAERINSSRLEPGQWGPLIGGCMNQVLHTLLEATPPPPMVGDYWRAMDALSRASATLKQPAAVPPLENLVAESLRAATDAVFILRGSRPPFGAGEPVAPAMPSATIGVLMEEARQAVRDLRDPGTASARTAAALALRSLSDVLTAMSGSTGGPTPPMVAEIRLQSIRLRSLDLLALGESGWVKAGLDAALTGLDQVTRGRAGASAVRPPLAVWIEQARGAIAAIDARTMFTFQRAAIQDAFRTVLTAFAVAVLSGEPPRATDDRSRRLAIRKPAYDRPAMRPAPPDSDAAGQGLGAAVQRHVVR